MKEKSVLGVFASWRLCVMLCAPDPDTDSDTDPDSLLDPGQLYALCPMLYAKTCLHV